MKLKAGGKAIVIALIVGVVGVGINMSGILDKKPQTEVAKVEEAPTEARPKKEVNYAQPYNSPQFQTEVAEKIVEDVQEVVEPAPQPQNSAAKNRGLNAVLGQGNK